MAPAIELRGVTKRFLTPSGGVYTALRDLNLTVQPGEFCAVVGPTGCGKSTTLALISGLEPPSEGEVDVLGEPVTGIADGIGYMFQSDAVFPWKTVLENVAAGFPGRRSWRTWPRALVTTGNRTGTPASRPGIGSPGLDWPASRTAIPTSCRAGCASVWRSRKA